MKTNEKAVERIVGEENFLFPFRSLHEIRFSSTAGREFLINQTVITNSLPATPLPFSFAIFETFDFHRDLAVSGGVRSHKIIEGDKQDG